LLDNEIASGCELASEDIIFGLEFGKFIVYCSESDGSIVERDDNNRCGGIIWRW